MAYKSICVEITQEHFERSIKGSPREAIKELIWNACDADAQSIASTAAVRTRSDFGIIPSPLHLARSLLFRRQPIMNHSVVGACFLHELQIKTVQHSTDGYAEQHP